MMDGVTLCGVFDADQRVSFCNCGNYIGFFDFNLAHIRVFGHHTEEKPVVNVADGARHHVAA